MDENELYRAITVLQADGDNAQADAILSQLDQLDPARAQQLRQRIQFRQQYIDAPLQSVQNLGSNVAEGVGDVASTVASTVSNALSTVGRGIGSALDQAGTNLMSNLAGRPIDSLDQFTGIVDDRLSGLLDPVGQAQQELAAQAAAASSIPVPAAVPEPNASVAASPPAAVRPTLPATGITQPPVGATQADLDLINGSLIARQQEMINAANLDGQLAVDRLNLQRTAQNLALQQTPQVANFLSPAAALAASPTIGAAPANVQQTLGLTQAVAPQVTVPSLLPAAQTNVRQQLANNSLEQKAALAQRRQQEKALQLAFEDFRQNQARTILSRPR